MLENPYYHNEDAKQERGFLRKAWAVIGAICFAILFGIAATWPTKAHAAPIATAEEGGIKIVLTDEDCTLQAVSNLKKRATWTEKGKTFEGCWGGHPAYPILMAYFSDRSVVIFHVEMFTRVTGV